ncbi:MAG: polymerase subunit delta [Bacteroidota bacterium]|jgi:DNA polymerase-3 subunit delta
MDPVRIIRDIEMKKYAPLYFLMGEEPYFIDLITQAIEEKILDESEKAFGETIVYGRDVSMEQILMLAKGFPMMGNYQTVIVKEAQDMKEWKKTDDLKGFENYLASPTPSTILVFCFKHKTLDKRLKVTKLIEKTAVLYNSEKIKDYKLPEWITTYAQSRGFKIGPDASTMLAEYLGTDLSKVVNEMNKLAIILPAGSTITPQIIEQNIGISKDYNVWELQKALGRKDILKSNRIIDYFESNPKANPIQMVIPSLYSFFNKLNIFLANKENPDLAKMMGVAPFALNDYKEAGKKYNMAKVERIIGYLRQADKRSKGVDNATISSGDLMRELVFKILH